jgi:hypothetical protein
MHLQPLLTANPTLLSSRLNILTSHEKKLSLCTLIIDKQKPVALSDINCLPFLNYNISVPKADYTPITFILGLAYVFKKKTKQNWCYF